MSIIQCFVLVRVKLGSSFSADDPDYVIYLLAGSLISGLVAILYRLNVEDSAVFQASANKKWPPSKGYFRRSVFRSCEIMSRLLVLSLIGIVAAERFVLAYFALDLFVNFNLYKKGLIGPTWMNIWGYTLCVVDLASVPSPAKLPDRHHDRKRKQVLHCGMESVTCFISLYIFPLCLDKDLRAWPLLCV